MKVFFLFLCSVCCFNRLSAQSQPDALYQKLQKNLHPSFNGQLPLNNLNYPGIGPSPSFPIDNTLHYNAFFCTMELMNRERFHIWIKLHAGRYDEYTRESKR